MDSEQVKERKLEQQENRCPDKVELFGLVELRDLQDDIEGTAPLRQVIADQNKKRIPIITTHVQYSERSEDLFSDVGMRAGVIHGQVHRGLLSRLLWNFDVNYVAARNHVFLS